MTSANASDRRWTESRRPALLLSSRPSVATVPPAGSVLGAASASAVACASISILPDLRAARRAICSGEREDFPCLELLPLPAADGRDRVLGCPATGVWRNVSDVVARRAA